jgi:hypothetical protein
MALVAVDCDDSGRAESTEELNRKQSQSTHADYHCRASRDEQWQGRLDRGVRRQAGVGEGRGKDRIKIPDRNRKAGLNHHVFRQTTVESNPGAR